MKKWYLVLIAFFIIPIILLFSISLFDKDVAVSDSENRTLKQFPEFSIKRLFNGEFTSDFEAYFQDQFPLRDSFLNGAKYINSLFSLSFGNTVIDVDIDDQWEKGGHIDPDIDNDDPIQTKPSTTGTEQTTESTTDNTSDGTTEPSSDSTTEPTSASTEPPATEKETTYVTSWTELPSPWEEDVTVSGDVSALDSGILFVGNRAMERVYKVESYLDFYADTISKVDSLTGDVRVFALLVPKSIEFYAPAKYRAGSASQLGAINYAYSKMKKGVICVNAYSEIFDHKDEYLYFRTDHHWTERGAYYAYRAFCESANLVPYELNDYTYETVSDFIGTMYSYTKQYSQSSVLLNNPDTVEIFRPVNVSTMEVYSDFSLTNPSVKNIIYSADYATNSLKKSGKYYVFLGGDRPICHIENPNVTNGRKLVIFKESYGNTLTPLLSDMFEEVWAIDPREFNGSNTPVYTNMQKFVSEHGITDILILNNVQSASPNYMKKIGRMFGQVYD